jgi:hypothetical protein
MFTKWSQSMKLLLDIALGRSIYTVYFFVALAISIVLAWYLETELAIKIALGFVCVMGVFIAVTAIATVDEAIESLGWPKANAKLGICKVWGHTGSPHMNSESYSPFVEYSFELNDQSYSGNSYILGTRTYSLNATEKIVGDIKSKGDSLLVSYNPADPSVNVLKPGINEVHYIRALVAVAIIGFTVSELGGWTHYVYT